MHRTSAHPVGPAASGVTEVELDGRVCLYAPDQQQMVFLNETASDVWRLADGERTVDEIVAVLAASYGTDPEAIADDVRAAIARFDEAGVLAAPPEAFTA